MRAADNDVETEDVTEPQRWVRTSWTVVVRSADHGGGFVAAVTRGADPEPLVTLPWASSKDPAIPKPLDRSAFDRCVRAARDVLARRERQRHGFLNRSLSSSLPDGRVLKVTLQLLPDAEPPHGVLTATDESGQVLGRSTVRVNFQLTALNVQRWVAQGMRSPD